MFHFSTSTSKISFFLLLIRLNDTFQKRIWKKQHDKRVYTSENGSLLFKAPVPSCSYMMESKYPRAMMHTMFPQAFMLSLAYKRKDMSPTCAFLYEAGTVTIQDQILAMGVSEQILPDGESVRKLQLPDVIGVTREAECRKIRKELLLNGTKVSGNLYRKFIDSCVTEFTSVLHGQNDYSSALNAINDYFCIKGKTRPMCAALPHFKGLCPGSDSTALDTMFFTEIGSNLPVYAEICYTNCASVWGLLYMLKVFFFFFLFLFSNSPFFTTVSLLPQSYHRRLHTGYWKVCLLQGNWQGHCSGHHCRVGRKH